MISYNIISYICVYIYICIYIMYSYIYMYIIQILINQAKPRFWNKSEFLDLIFTTHRHETWTPMVRAYETIMFTTSC